MAGSTGSFWRALRAGAVASAVLLLILHLAIAVHGFFGVASNHSELDELRPALYVERFALVAGILMWASLASLLVAILATAAIGSKQWVFELGAAGLVVVNLVVPKPLSWQSLAGPSIQERTAINLEAKGYVWASALDLAGIVLLVMVLWLSASGHASGKVVPGGASADGSANSERT